MFLGYNSGMLKKYWTLLAIVLILVAVIGMSQYAESSKQNCEHAAREAQAAAVAKGEDQQPHKDAENACRTHILARYFAWPEGVGAWAVILTLLAIAWQSVETLAAAKATEVSVSLIEKQTGILKQSADISRGAIVPTLRILDFDMGGSDPLINHEMEFTVRNYGATPAILEALHIYFDQGERWPTAEGESVSFIGAEGRAVIANSQVVLRSSPYICLVSPDLIDRFRREHRSIYAHVRLKYLDVFDSPLRILIFSVHLNESQNGTIRCEVTSQWNEYENPQNPN